MESARDKLNTKGWTEKGGLKRSSKTIEINLRLAGMDTAFTLQEQYNGRINDTPFRKLSATLNAADTVIVWYLLQATPDNNTIKRGYEIENATGEKLYVFYDSTMQQLVLFIFLLLVGIALLVYSIRRIFGSNDVRGERVV